MLGNALKLAILRDEMLERAKTKPISDYFKGQYTNLAGAVDVMLRQGYNEAQLQDQIDHFKGNMSTFQMVINAFAGKFEEKEPEEVKYVQMTLF